MIVPKRRRPTLKFETSWSMPQELERSAPRQVTWTAAGYFMMALACLVFAFGIVAALLLSARIAADRALAADLERSAIVADARVVSTRITRGENKKKYANYVYQYEGREYEGRATVRKREWSQVDVGTVLPVRFLPSNPGRSWVRGSEPKGAPIAAVIIIPAAAALGAVAIAALLLFQRRVLTEWRATEAKVLSAKKHNTGEGTIYKVEYEYRDLSGAVHRSRKDSSKAPPEGASITLLYDRDNPKRTASYPMTFVRPAY